MGKTINIKQLRETVKKIVREAIDKSIDSDWAELEAINKRYIDGINETKINEQYGVDFGDTLAWVQKKVPK